MWKSWFDLMPTHRLGITQSSWRCAYTLGYGFPPTSPPSSPPPPMGTCPRECLPPGIIMSNVGRFSIVFFKCKFAPCYPHDAGFVQGSAIIVHKTFWAIHSSKTLNDPLGLQAMAWETTMPWYLAKGERTLPCTIEFHATHAKWNVPLKTHTAKKTSISN